VSFSADGRRLAYVQAIHRTAIARVTIDPATARAIGAPEWVVRQSTPTTNPDLSPDGRLLVTDSQSANQEDLLIVDVATGAIRPITNDVVKDRLPRWSADGQRIIFFSNRTGKSELWSIRPDGTDMRRLTHTTGAGINTPVISPDGTRLAYHQSGHTWLWPLDRPWDPRSLEEMTPIPEFPREWTTTTAWSPDGRRLAGWVQHESDAAGIDVYDVDTHRHTRLTSYGSTPVFMADGERLIFIDQNKVLLVDARTRSVSTVMTFDDRFADSLTLSRDNRTLYVGTVADEADVWVRSTRE